MDHRCDLAWTSITGIDQRGRWRLRERGHGRTRVEFRLSYGVAGSGIGGWLAGDGRRADGARPSEAVAPAAQAPGRARAAPRGRRSPPRRAHGERYLGRAQRLTAWRASTSTIRPWRASGAASPARSSRQTMPAMRAPQGVERLDRPPAGAHRPLCRPGRRRRDDPLRDGIGAPARGPRRRSQLPGALGLRRRARHRSRRDEGDPRRSRARTARASRPACCSASSTTRRRRRARRPVGIVTHTGVAGLTLGGGIGWIIASTDSRSTSWSPSTSSQPPGEHVTASETENADLFWGVRGGGGNFGIVTAFEFRCSPSADRCSPGRSSGRSRSRRTCCGSTATGSPRPRTT